MIKLVMWRSTADGGSTRVTPLGHVSQGCFNNLNVRLEDLLVDLCLSFKIEPTCENTVKEFGSGFENIFLRTGRFLIALQCISFLAKFPFGSIRAKRPALAHEKLQVLIIYNHLLLTLITSGTICTPRKR